MSPATSTPDTIVLVHGFWVTRRSVITEVEEFEGPHRLPASPAWEKVADYALDWALEHAALPSTR
jgi:hypothetical protein